MIKSTLIRLKNMCAYSHIVRIILMLMRGESSSEQVRLGRNIALLELFCPFFWIALFTGASGTTLLFHGIHSGIVFLIGVVIMAIDFIKQTKHS